MISWVAIDRMVTREMAANEKFRATVAHRPLRLRAKNQSDEELLERLRGFGIEMNRSLLAKLGQDFFSAEAAVKSLKVKSSFNSKKEQLESDWIWICVDALWQRWLPDVPSFERLDDKMQEGYDLMQSEPVTAACHVWLEAWDDVLYFFNKANFRSISEFDDRFHGTQCLFNWIQDLEMELWNAGLDDRQFLFRRIEFCEQALKMFGPQETSLQEGCRRALAETHAELGDRTKTDSLYAEWLKTDPQWGAGWVGWADCYWFAHTQSKDLPRAEALLRGGLAVEGVREFDFLAERMAEVCKEQGRIEEAEAYYRKATLHRERTHSASAKQFDQLPEVSKVLRSSAFPAVSSKQKVGRNDPCPCGSGKKFKKCCG